MLKIIYIIIITKKIHIDLITNLSSFIKNFKIGDFLENKYSNPRTLVRNFIFQSQK